MSLFNYEDGRGSDQYVSDLLSLIQAGKSEGMTPPAQMQVSVRPPPQMNLSGGGGMTEEQAEDAEKAQIISAIGGALSGGIGAYGASTGGGAYGAGGAGGLGGLGGAGASPGVSAAQANQLNAQGVVPRGPSTVAYNPETMRTAQIKPTYGSTPNSYVDSVLQQRGFQTPGATKTSPTGASAIKTPGIMQLVAGFQAQPTNEEASRAAFRGRRPGGMAPEDAWQLYAGNGSGRPPSNVIEQGAMPPEFVLSGGTYGISQGGISPQTTQYSHPYGMYSGQGY